MDAKEEGRRHFRRYGADYRNPYPPGTYEHNEFERGWSQELKARPELIEVLEKSRSQKRQRAGSQVAQDLSERAAAAKAYRERRGK